MIYLDYQATTPLAPEVREEMLRWLDGPDGTGFGNPHSSHRFGREAAAAVELARERIAALLPQGGQVIFTSGATESINLAMRGCEPGRAGDPVMVSTIEHSAVLRTAERLPGQHTRIPVNSEGVIDPAESVPQGTGLVCVMQANNEIGTVQPVEEVYRQAQAKGALYLLDAVQAAGKMQIAEADMIAISAHKFHGPKGIGALWIRDGVEIEPQMTGGGQEGKLRSGTLSPALCAGFGMAAKVAMECMEEDEKHVSALFDRALELLPDWTLNGSATHRYKGNLNVHREGIDVARLMSDVRGVCFSAGSACASEEGKPSRILGAIGLNAAQAKGSIRIGFGRYTKMEELEEALVLIDNAAAQQG